MHGAAITDSADWVEESLEEEIKVPSHEDVLLYLQEQKYRQVIGCCISWKLFCPQWKLF